VGITGIPLLVVKEDMSDFCVGGNHHSPIPSKSVPSESYNDLLSRHKAEAKELDDVIKALLKGAKKADKAQLEARAIQMRFDLRAKHQEEEDLNFDPTDAGERHSYLCSSYRFIRYYCSINRW